ncbi:MAG: hypothetical protein QGF67_08835 [Lentisphaeria bacterium]|jgi:hypothetical protein|nr:hypothetical protein [Lentisphaeria bacterium]MDP7741532.1 hypothetical protein [Lentisphaeria bacterium]
MYRTEPVNVIRSFAAGIFICCFASPLFAADSVRNKLRMKIPKISFENASLDTVIAELKELSQTHDPDREGINIVHVKPDAGNAAGARLVTLEFNNIPLGEAIRYVCLAAKASYKVEEHAVIIASGGVRMNNMQTRVYPIAVGCLDQIATRSSGGGIGDDTDEGGGRRRTTARDYFENKGVNFPANAKIDYDGRSGKLFATNTVENLRRIERILNQLCD